MDGDIAAAFWWNSLLDATDMEELWEYFAGLLDAKAAPVAFTNTGPICGWVDGKIECFADNWPVLGTEMPPGATGATTPADGMYFDYVHTNSAIQSRTFSAGWVESGGNEIGAASDVGLFRDGRPTVALTDDSAGSYESITQTFAKSGSTSAIVCAYAYALATETIQVLIGEITGGGCGTPSSFDRPDLTATTWTEVSLARTFTDAGCTSFTVSLYPAVGNPINVAETGTVHAVVQVFRDQDYCPPTYIETAAAAVTAGDQAPIYDISGTDIIDGSGNLVGKKQIEFDFTPGTSANPATTYLFMLSDNSASDWVALAWDTNEKLLLLDESGTFITSSSAMNVPGTTYSVKAVINFTADDYEIFIDGSSEGTDATARTSPTGITDLNIGALYDESAQVDGWVNKVTVKQ
jgi:hypothetical protein